MKNQVLLEHYLKVDKAILYALLMCFTIFFLVNFSLGAGLLLSSVFLLGSLIIIVANISVFNQTIMFKRYVYIIVTTAILVFLFCVDSNFSIITAMFGFTLGVVMYFQFKLILFYGVTVILGNIIGVLLASNAYTAYPLEFWIRTGAVFFVAIVVAGILTKRAQEIIIYAEQQAIDAEQKADQIMQISKKVAIVANDLASESEQLSATTEQTYASLEQVASTANEFSSLIDSVNAKTRDIDETSKEMSNVANAGRTTVESVADQTNYLQSRIQQTADIIETLGCRSREIENIISTINEVSEQTNLLALNAAIEAARAGEQGRGFAVVANEVKDLAEQVAKASENITKMIISIQEDAAEAVKETKENSNQVLATVESATSAAKDLAGIINYINGIVQEINSVAISTQQISKGSQEIAAATQQQSATVGEVSSMAERLSVLVQELNNLLKLGKEN